MNSATVLSRLRLFLLSLSALIFVGTVIELLLTEHVESVTQLIPFALCGVGLVAALIVLWRPRRAPLLGLRACMVLVALGSLFGVYEHVASNIAFQREIRPNAPTRDVVLGSFGGASPLLAPGILAVAARLAAAATNHHPALARGN